MVGDLGNAVRSGSATPARDGPEAVEPLLAPLPGKFDATNHEISF